MLDRPAVGALLGPFQRRDGKPKNRAAHRVLSGNNFAVVVAHGLTGPANSFRFFRQVHIHEGHLLFREEQIDDFADVRLELGEVWLTAVGDRCAYGDAAQSEQRGLAAQKTGIETAQEIEITVRPSALVILQPGRAEQKLA